MSVRYLERHLLSIITSVFKFLCPSESKRSCCGAETTYPKQPRAHNRILYQNHSSQIFSSSSATRMGPIKIPNSQQIISLPFGDLPGDTFSQYCVSAGSELRRKKSLILLFNISPNASLKQVSELHLIHTIYLISSLETLK